jgi:PAS domain S-box-containing protein
LEEPFKMSSSDLKNELSELKQAYEKVSAQAQEIRKEVMQKELALKEMGESQQFYKSMIELTNAIHWEYSFGLDKFTYVSPQAEEILGYPVEQWTDYEFWASHIHDEDRGWVKAYCMEHTQKLQGHEFVYRMRASDGRYVWLHDYVHVKAEDNVPILLQGIMVDVTKTREIEAELAYNENFLQSIINNEPECVKLLDSECGLISMNPAGLAMIEVPELEMVLGHSVIDIITPEFKDEFRDFTKRVCEGERGTITFEIVGMNGTHRWLESHAVPFEDKANDRTLLLGITRDITERRVTDEKLKQALVDKDLLMKEIHHRVKNNLAVIQSLLSLQARGISDEKAKAYFVDSQNRVKSMAMIHESLQQSDDVTSVRSASYIKSFVNSIFHNYKTSVQLVRLEYDIEDISIDVDRMIPIGLIVNELVSNSLKYAFLDKVEGVLSISLSSGEAGYTLVVKDTGVGLPEGFELEKSKTLGLQIVSSLVAQLEGSVVVASDKESGTEFKISF